MGDVNRNSSKESKWNSANNKKINKPKNKQTNKILNRYKSEFTTPSDGETGTLYFFCFGDPTGFPIWETKISFSSIVSFLLHFTFSLITNFHPESSAKISRPWFLPWEPNIAKKKKKGPKTIQKTSWKKPGRPFSVILTESTVQKVKEVKHIPPKWKTAEIIIQGKWEITIWGQVSKLRLTSLVYYFNMIIKAC